MTQPELLGLIDLIRTSKQCIIHEPATDQEIDGWTRSLKPIKVPGAYVALIREFGFIEIGSSTIYGMGSSSEPNGANVRKITTFERVMASPQLRSEFIPIMADGMGNHYCLDTSRVSRDDCSVVFWQHDHPKGEMQMVKLVNKSFISWLVGLIKENE